MKLTAAINVYIYIYVCVCVCVCVRACLCVFVPPCKSRPMIFGILSKRSVTAYKVKKFRVKYK